MSENHPYRLVFSGEPGGHPGPNWIETSLPIRVSRGDVLRLFIDEKLLAANQDKEFIRKTIYWRVDRVVHWAKISAQKDSFHQDVDFKGTTLYVSSAGFEGQSLR